MSKGIGGSASVLFTVNGEEMFSQYKHGDDVHKVAAHLVQHNCDMGTQFTLGGVVYELIYDTHRGKDIAAVYNVVTDTCVDHFDLDKLAGGMASYTGN